MSSRRHFIKASGLLASALLLDPSRALASPLSATPATPVIKPPRLQAGDTVAITSPAGAVWDEKQIDTFAAILRGFGFNVVFGKTLHEKYGYFAGTDELRAHELNELFADKTIKGIFCMKGGWGCARLLSRLDFVSIAKNPKVLIGFSDITTLLIAIQAQTGLVTFHGPVGNSGWNDFTGKVFRSVIMNAEATVFPKGPGPDDTPIILSPGIASGQLVGGNLSVLAGIVGSGYLPDWKNKILFLEEAKEEPYRIDRMLTQLKLAGILDALSGIAFGKFVKCEAEEPQKAFTFMEVIRQHVEPLRIPAFYGAMTGHIENKLTLPLGVPVKMDAGAGTLSLLENATS